MKTIVLCGFLVAMCLSCLPATGADAGDLSTAVGTVAKVEKETLTVRTSDKPVKSLNLTLTGTSRFHLVSPQTRSGKTVLTQRSAEATDLSPGQEIAVIYTAADKDSVLLTAVIKAADDKK